MSPPTQARWSWRSGRGVETHNADVEQRQYSRLVKIFTFTNAMIWSSSLFPTPKRPRQPVGTRCAHRIWYPPARNKASKAPKLTSRHETPHSSSLVPRIIPRTPTPPLRATPPHLAHRHHIRPRRPPRLPIQLLIIHHHDRPRCRRPVPTVVSVRAVVVTRPRPPVAVPAARPPVHRARPVVVPPLPVRVGRRRGRLVVARQRAHDPPDQEEADDGADDDADDGAGVEAAAARVGVGAGVGGDDGGGRGVGVDGDGRGGRVLAGEEVREEGEGGCWCHVGGGHGGWVGPVVVVGWNGFEFVSRLCTGRVGRLQRCVTADVDHGGVSLNNGVTDITDADGGQTMTRQVGWKQI